MKQLTVSLVLVVISAVIGLGWLVNEVYHSIDNDDVAGEFGLYQSVGQDLASTLDSLDKESRERFLNRWQQTSALTISLQDRMNFPIPDSLSMSFEQGKALILESEQDVSLHFYMEKSQAVMTLLFLKQKTDVPLVNVNLIFTLAFYIGVVVILLIWLYPLIGRLIILRSAARTFGQGDLSSRVSEGRLSYIADIEVEFNRMADRIETLIGDNKLLSRAVSHDLKTPLARLRFGVDALEEVQDSKTRFKYLDRISNDLCEMESLVDTLLKYARLDEANVELYKETIPMEDFIRSLFTVHNEIETHIDYRFECDNALIETDRRYVAMLFNNLMNNAIKHARSQIMVTFKKEAQGFVFSIEDDGLGIPEEQREKAIQPFWRGDHGIKGHGMGLAIVNRIAEWLGVTLNIDESSDLGGAKVSLYFKQ